MTLFEIKKWGGNCGFKITIMSSLYYVPKLWTMVCQKIKSMTLKCPLASANT